jgi:hypothetical protein
VAGAHLAWRSLVHYSALSLGRPRPHVAAVYVAPSTSRGGHPHRVRGGCTPRRGRPRPHVAAAHFRVEGSRPLSRGGRPLHVAAPHPVAAAPPFAWRAPTSRGGRPLHERPPTFAWRAHTSKRGGRPLRVAAHLTWWAPTSRRPPHAAAAHFAWRTPTSRGGRPPHVMWDVTVSMARALPLAALATKGTSQPAVTD